MNDLSTSGEQAEQNPRRMRHVSLASRQRELVRQLPGFQKKTHRIPSDVNSHTQAFVTKLGASRVKEDLDRVFQNLRTAFRFKRTEIDSTDWEEGAGAITTPYFRYASAIHQAADAPDESIWQRDVSEIQAPEHLMSEGFLEVFGDTFDTVEFNPPEPIELEQIIDRVESVDDPGIQIDYDRQITFAEVRFEHHDECIHVTRDSFRIVHSHAVSPQALIESLFRVQQRLLGIDD